MFCSCSRRCRSSTTDWTTSLGRTTVGVEPCWRLKRERLRMMALARALSFLMRDEIASRLRRKIRIALKDLGEPRDRLQRVVELVRDARQQHADRRQSFLPDDLLLQRLYFAPHSALLLHLRRDRLAGRAQAIDHVRKRRLQMLELARRHGIARDFGEVAGPHPIRRALELDQRRQPAPDEERLEAQEHQRGDARDRDRVPIERAGAPPRDLVREAGDDLHRPSGHGRRRAGDLLQVRLGQRGCCSPAPGRARRRR